MEKSKITETEIIKVLLDLGIEPHLKGFECLKTAIDLVNTVPTYRNNITKELYPDIAEMLGEKPARVEKATRHALHSAYKHSKPMQELFPVKSPCPSLFICSVVERMRAGLI